MGVRRAVPLVPILAAFASLTAPARPLSIFALVGCCSSWEPSFAEAVSVVKEQASDDFSCSSGDVAASLVATAHTKQATVRAQGCSQAATYDCSVSCGDWSCSRMAR